MLLKKIRKAHGLSQKEMAYKLKIGNSTYCQYENGIRKVPKDKAHDIARILNVKIEDIFFSSWFTIREK